MPSAQVFKVTVLSILWTSIGPSLTVTTSYMMSASDTYLDNGWCGASHQNGLVMSAIKALAAGPQFVESGEWTQCTSEDCVDGNTGNTQTDSCLAYYTSICALLSGLLCQHLCTPV